MKKMGTTLSTIFLLKELSVEEEDRKHLKFQEAAAVGDAFKPTVM